MYVCTYVCLHMFIISIKEHSTDLVADSNVCQQRPTHPIPDSCNHRSQRTEDDQSERKTQMLCRTAPKEKSSQNSQDSDNRVDVGEIVNLGGEEDGDGQVNLSNKRDIDI